jgi:transposase InsO family protein
VKFAFIEGVRGTFDLRLLCHLLCVARSGYYKWRTARASTQRAYRAEALAAVREVFEQSQRTYGSPRIQRELKARGRSHSPRFVAGLMHSHGLRARAAVRRRPRSGPSEVSAAIENVLQRQFHVPAVNSVWVADLTYIATLQGWLFLAVVLDLGSRRVVGWSTSHAADAMLTGRALEMAVLQRRPPRGLIHHSDRGVQYSCTSYLLQLARSGIKPSFSRIGNCWDNAVAESFFHTLKVERLQGRARYATRAEATRDLVQYIEGWYNTKRRHSTLGYISPAEFERRL